MSLPSLLVRPRLAALLTVVAVLACACGGGSGGGGSSRGSEGGAGGQAATTTGDTGGHQDRTPGGGPAPAGPFHATNESVGKLVEEVLGPEVDGVKRLRSALCFEGACEVQYNVLDPGTHEPEATLLEEPREIWKTLFRDPNVAQAILEAWGPTEGSGGKVEVVPLIVVSCSRAGTEGIDWDTVTAAGMKQGCVVRPEVTF